MRSMQKDSTADFSFGYFVFTLLFAVKVLARMDDEVVNQINTFIAGILGLASIVVFSLSYRSAMVAIPRLRTDEAQIGRSPAGS